MTAEYGEQGSTATQMHALVALQHADGSWELTPEFARAIGHDLGQLESRLSGVTGDMNEAKRAWATALALAWLEQQARDLGILAQEVVADANDIGRGPLERDRGTTSAGHQGTCS